MQLVEDEWDDERKSEEKYDVLLVLYCWGKMWKGQNSETKIKNGITFIFEILETSLC